MSNSIKLEDNKVHIYNSFSKYYFKHDKIIFNPKFLYKFLLNKITTASISFLVRLEKKEPDACE
jgi:hypothetical protein